MSERSLYKLLQVDPAADADVIIAAHRVLVSKLDPDHDASGVAEYRVQELNRALAVLTDATQRQAYDEQLASGRSNGRVAMGPGLGGNLADRLLSHEADEVRNIRLDFGRYSGWSLGELARSDPDYLRWLSRHSSGIRYRGAIMRLLAERDAGRTPLRVSP
jgi:DnaJ-class molecular chaperone